jgi:hypothetical protein
VFAIWTVASIALTWRFLATISSSVVER